MSLHLSEREELFFILSIKLEKEDAELLEKKISTWILEKENKFYEIEINTIKENINNCNKLFVDSKNIRQSLENVANGRELSLWKFILKKFNNKLNSNKDNLIEILK